MDILLLFKTIKYLIICLDIIITTTLLFYLIDNDANVVFFTFFPRLTAPCTTNPCHNGGGCSVAGDSYVCVCALGWVGENCEEGQ